MSENQLLEMLEHITGKLSRCCSGSRRPWKSLVTTVTAAANR
jgi:hypothetical protein